MPQLPALRHSVSYAASPASQEFFLTCPMIFCDGWPRKTMALAAGPSVKEASWHTAAFRLRRTSVGASPGNGQMAASLDVVAQERGAPRGIGGESTANPVTSSGSMAVPIVTSLGRSGFGPQRSLSTTKRGPAASGARSAWPARLRGFPGSHSRRFYEHRFEEDWAPSQGPRYRRCTCHDAYGRPRGLRHLDVVGAAGGLGTASRTCSCPPGKQSRHFANCPTSLGRLENRRVFPIDMPPRERALCSDREMPSMFLPSGGWR